MHLHPPIPITSCLLTTLLLTTTTTTLQGTLYPDVIESCPPPGSGQKHSHTIKSHHNVGGLPKDLQFQLVEPFRELFKDEVRQIGRLLGVPEQFIKRHPFPGGQRARMLGRGYTMPTCRGVQACAAAGTLCLRWEQMDRCRPLLAASCLVPPVTPPPS